MKRIKCFFFGHIYRPIHEFRSSYVVRYHCDRCGKPTAWMNRSQEKRFIRHHCPTWGKPRSDSQGYRESK